MKIDEITKIEQSFEKEQVNELLAKGYRIIKIFSSKIRTEEIEEIKPIFILGLTSEKN